MTKEMNKEKDGDRNKAAENQRNEYVSATYNVDRK